MAVKIQVNVLWDLATSIFTLKMDAVKSSTMLVSYHNPQFSKMLVTYHNNIWHHNTEDINS